jgi:molecular chaperone GrpE
MTNDADTSLDGDDDVVDAEVVDLGAEPDEPDGSDEPIVEVAATGEDESSEDTLARERGEYLDALRQVQADFENYRKRVIKQQADAIERATGRLIDELLPVLDACDAGIEHGDEGVTPIFTALLGTLERVGLERLDPVGEPFDPNAHEAVLHEASDGDDDGPTVADVMRPGYVWKGRVLRAAMVKVKG